MALRLPLPLFEEDSDTIRNSPSLGDQTALSEATHWAQAQARIAQQWRTWQDQTITLTGPFDTTRAEAPPRSGRIGAVTAHGFVFCYQGQPNDWGERATLRLFVAWHELWAQEHRIQVQGTCCTQTPWGPVSHDVGRWVSHWIAETAAGWPNLRSAATPRKR